MERILDCSAVSGQRPELSGIQVNNRHGSHPRPAPGRYQRERQVDPAAPAQSCHRRDLRSENRRRSEDVPSGKENRGRRDRGPRYDAIARMGRTKIIGACKHRQVIVIYALVDPRTDVLRYVGMTKHPRKRYWRHCHPGPRNRTHRAQWIRALKQSGLKPEFIPLEEVASDDEAAISERFWIASLRAAGALLLNFAAGGEGGDTCSGRKLSSEHRAKIAASHIGLKASPEACAKMSASRTGIPYSEERKRQKAATVPRGYSRPEEVKAKITTGLRRQWTTRQRPLLHPLKVEHGTATGYLRGCRCSSCKQAKSIAHRRQRAAILIPTVMPRAS